MPRTKKGRRSADPNNATAGYVARLRQMGDGLRRDTGVVEYKHVILGLLFLKYIPKWGGMRVDRRHLQGHGLCPERVCP